MTDRVSQQVLAGFMTKPNVDLLKSEIRKRFAAPDKIIEQLPALMRNHQHAMWRDLQMDDPVTRSADGDVVLEQIYAADAKFLGNLSTYFEQQLPVSYTVTDGHATANGVYRGKEISTMRPDDMLKAWRERPGRQITLRDDSQSRNTEFGKRAATQLGSPYSSGSPFSTPAGDFPNVAGRASGTYSGITYCDQSDMGQNQYYDAWMNRPEMHALNDWSRPFYREADLGGTMADEDAKAFTQRIMSSYDPNVPDGSIPSYRRWLHVRNYDRDADEAFDAPQHEFVQRGYDRRTLIDRIAAIRAASSDDKYQSFPRRGTLNPPAPERHLWQ